VAAQRPREAVNGAGAEIAIHPEARQISHSQQFKVRAFTHPERQNGGRGSVLMKITSYKKGQVIENAHCGIIQYRIRRFGSEGAVQATRFVCQRSD
jgi:hypothetical protein